MNNENYMCPRCNSRMSWTGNVCQHGTHSCSILFVYKCTGWDCGYKEKYTKLDSSGEKHLSLINCGIID